MCIQSSFHETAPPANCVCKKQKTKQNKTYVLFSHSNMFLRRKKDKHTSMFVHSNHCIWWWNHLLGEGEAISHHIFCKDMKYIVSYAGVKVHGSKLSCEAIFAYLIFLGNHASTTPLASACLHT